MVCLKKEEFEKKDGVMLFRCPTRCV